MNLHNLRLNLCNEATNSTAWLRKWLDDDEVDPYHWSTLVPQWAEEMDIDIGDADNYEELKAPQKKAFEAWLQMEYETGRLFNNPPEFHQPNTYFTGGKILSANDWLIHLTPKAENAHDIAKNGFKHGVMSHNIHLSWTASKFEKDAGEFAFAFKVDNNYWHRAIQENRYGIDAVMFQTESGVQSYHRGDQESQVIFDKDKTRNRVPVYYSGSDGEWFVEDKRSERELFTGPIDDVVEWVMKNFDQYRKAIAYGPK